MYQLSAQLTGHAQDVKCVIGIDENRVASASRDGSVRIWTKDEGKWEGIIVRHSAKFINSLVYDKTSGTLFYGGQEHIIYGVLPVVTEEDEPVYTLIGHESNVCSLSGDLEWLISGSWDKTARVWHNGMMKWELRGHTASVWDAKMLGDGRVLTASADKTIKLWENGSCIKTFSSVHKDVVRNICILDDGEHFVSCSNDGTLKLCDLEGYVLHEFVGHESFVYMVKQLHSGEIVSCGEDRSVRIWNLDGTVKQVITLPATSIWSVDVLPNDDILIGSSDNMIRIFTMDPQRYATEEDIQSLREQIEKSAINAQTIGFDESKLSPYEVLERPGNKEGQIIVVKSPLGVIEAYQFSSDAWTKVGDVVSSVGNDQKVDYEGGKYDFVFDVDVYEGQPPLKLPVNASDNPYEVADKFISRYELPSSYKDQIVQFIIKNTGSTVLNPMEETVTQKDVKYSILPVQKYLKQDTFNPDVLFNGIVKLNEKEKTFDDEGLSTIGAALHDVENNVEILYAHAEIIRNQWTSNKTPAYDLVRILTPKLTSSNDLSDYIQEGLTPDNAINTMLTTRMLVNSFSNPIWGSELMGSKALYESVFQILDSAYPNCKPQQKNNLAISIATLVFNYTVYIILSGNMDIVPIVADVLNTKYGPSSLFLDSEEATYRLLVAFGNLSTVEPSLHQYARSITWIRTAKDKYGKLPRFETIFTDIYI